MIVDPITDIVSRGFISRTAVACRDNDCGGRLERSDNRDEPDDQESPRLATWLSVCLALSHLSGDTALSDKPDLKCFLN